eukprot:11902271-Prorocentrum_lima.AAC.1
MLPPHPPICCQAVVPILVPPLSYAVQLPKLAIELCSSGLHVRRELRVDNVKDGLLHAPKDGL